MTTGGARWMVKLDSGSANTCGSMQSAADLVRTVLETGNPVEMWHVNDDGAWALYERFEPEMCGCHDPARPVADHAGHYRSAVVVADRVTATGTEEGQ